MTRLAIWLHRKRTGHHTYTWTDSVTALALGHDALVTCDCDRMWFL